MIATTDQGQRAVIHQFLRSLGIVYMDHQARI